MSAQQQIATPPHQISLLAEWSKVLSDKLRPSLSLSFGLFLLVGFGLILSLIAGPLKEDVRQLNRRMDRVELAMDKLQTKVDSRLDKMEGRLDKMEGRLDKMEDRLDKMDGRLIKVEGHLHRIEDKLDKLLSKK